MLPIVGTAVLLFLIGTLLLVRDGKKLQLWWKSVTTKPGGQKANDEKSTPKIDVGEKKKKPSVVGVTPVKSTDPPSKQREARQLSQYKDLYYKLHNLESHEEVLPAARDQLIQLFAETLSESSLERPTESILKLDTYDKQALAAFIKEHDDKVNDAYEKYIERRKKGGPPELFEDKDEAAWYLRQIAPVKYVDGAWLGYINRTTLPFHLRKIVKQSWQVLSEELGDGDLEKNHTYCFRELTNKVAPELPPADSPEFVDPKFGMDQPDVWKSALGQLLISLFPHEFFPEILGFNMQFEAITLETLRAAREIKDVGLDPYYFVLHVSIDNADSGHTAMALAAVNHYMDKVQREQGDEAAHQAWRRIQAGYNLSDSLPGKAVAPSKRVPAVENFPRNKLEARVVEIFRAKAESGGHKIHCQSRLKVGGKPLVDWLDPAVISDKQQQMEFIDAFSNLRPWIKKGDSRNSKLVHELDWGGRMFGAFTHSEDQLVRQWIDNMPNSNPEYYWNWTGRQKDLTSLHNSEVPLPSDETTRDTLREIEWRNPEAAADKPMPDNMFDTLCDVSKQKIDQKTFFPLWFMHPSILEGFVAVPWKTTSPFACAIIRILRAQSGFDIEQDAVAGTDECNREHNPGLVEIGFEMQRALGIAEVPSLKDALRRGDSRVADAIFYLSQRPQENKALLVGFATAFVALHRALCECALLSAESQDLLKGIVDREKVGVAECLETLDDHELRVCARGYWLAVGEVQKCFTAA